ncbi:hypothetical protein LADH09A_002804 [Micromonospora sp. LAH09]|uniref:hypothetical protein n=1 Tax=Micromonospora cabrerizensis TaxID=2911213 RepID=UPI001EE87C5E|nr:hypothetical protein [Micromonospora cabrerizensis]MCG5468904.1 hypothetical protein [Micromonospora cabrerizensis]
MTNAPTIGSGDEVPSTALVKRVLAEAGAVLIIEASGDELDRPDAARTVVSGTAVAELASLLAVVDGGTGDHCLCMGWPTILVSDTAGREIARWTLHHQTSIRGLGRCDADLRDAPALTSWLADRGLTGSRDVQQLLAGQAAEENARRVQWVTAAPPALAEAAEAASRRETDAEERLADLVARRYPDANERIRTLVAWAGFPPRHTTTTGGTPWYELVPERMLLTEPTESIFNALTSTTLTSSQLDGAAELFTTLEWAASQRADIPDSLRSVLITHVRATGTDPMKFRMRHGYGAE